HINLATVVTVAPDGQSASVRTSQLGMIGLNTQYAYWELGAYENRFVKQRGVWKIKAVHYSRRMRTDYDEGWARDGRPAPPVNRTFPAARPPSGSVVAASAANGDIAALERSLDAAIAVDAVENLNSSYGYYIDESAWDDMADTYASGGSKE